MSKKVRIVDIAQDTGLALSLVSYVLNNRTDKPVSAEARERVLQSAKRLGYVPNPLARALRIGKTNTIALSLSTFTEPFACSIAQELTRKALQSGYRALVIVEDDEKQSSTKDQLFYRMLPVDGVIVARMSPETIRMLRDARNRTKQPLVVIGDDILEGVDNVHYRWLDGAKAGVRHLVGEGCRQIAYVQDIRSTVTDQRYVAYHQILQEAGLEPYVIPSENLRASAYHAVLAYLREHPEIDGLFCHNDDMALGAYHALDELGKRIPDDVAVLGFDGLPEGEYARPPLSSVVIPLPEICQSAWQLLQERLTTPDLPPRVVEFTAQLQVRASSVRHGDEALLRPLDNQHLPK